MNSVTVFSPAKINLFLAVTGKRPDGFHSLVSVVAPLCFGDSLQVSTQEGKYEDNLECDHPEVPLGGKNLILHAARIFRRETGSDQPGFRFVLKKNIPIAAGLGGGSSNAVAALQALEQLTGIHLKPECLEQMAAELGSDCPLFLKHGPVVIRGRGEAVEALEPEVGKRLEAFQVLVVKPAFGVDTAWAYGQFTKRRVPFSSESQAEERVREWVAGRIATGAFLSNDFERVVLQKFLALDVLIPKLRKINDLHVLLSGSGSAFYCLSERNEPLERGMELALDCLGDSSSCIRTRFPSL